MKRIGLISVFFLVTLLVCASFHAAHAQSARGLAIPGDRLPKGLAETAPKDFFLPSDQKKVGLVHALEGTLVITHGKTKEAYFAAAGDEIYENDSLTTLVDSRCRIRFVDEDIVTMAPDTEFLVESFDDQRSEGKKSSLFRMVKGKALFYAMRLFRYRETRITLATPTATIGVRGTKFGAHVYYEDDKVAGGGVLVADSGNEIAPYLAQGAGGGRSFTDCFSEDGVLNVNGQSVPPGQMFSGRTGQVIPTPPNVIQSFRQATQMRGEGGSTSRAPGLPAGSGGGGTGPAGSLVSLAGAPPPAALADIQARITTTVQTEVTTQTEQQAAVAPPQITPFTGNLRGYFSILLSRNGSPQDAFVNSSDAAAGTNIDVQAFGVEHSADSYRHQDIAGAGGLDSAFIGGISGSNLLQNTKFSPTYVGQLSYIQWGYWQAASPTEFTVGGNLYRFINDRAWFVEGTYLTKNSDISTIVSTLGSGPYGYSGNVNGTYNGPDGSANLQGSFTCDVNLGGGSPTVNNFNLNASGGGHTATYATGSGTITPSAAGNSFILSGGTAKIDNTSATGSKVNGSLYGPKAEEIGGNWGITDSVNQKNAGGVFGGKR